VQFDSRSFLEQREQVLERGGLPAGREVEEAESQPAQSDEPLHSDRAGEARRPLSGLDSGVHIAEVRFDQGSRPGSPRVRVPDAELPTERLAGPSVCERLLPVSGSQLELDEPPQVDQPMGSA
jgi:hypothetical protein